MPDSSKAKKDWVPYVVPFILFMLFTEAGRYIPAAAHLLYIVKTITVGGLLWFWRHSYTSDFTFKMSHGGLMAAAAAGFIVLAIWILPDKLLPQHGTDDVFNPFSFNIPQVAAYTVVAVRLFGAVIVVPLMEELFWRSFLLRYLVNPDFKKVAIGTFSWFSFIAVVILFGIEHHRLVQGVIAGVIYTALVIYQKNLTGCVLAHALTNLGLGIYVIATQSWEFW